MLFYYDFYLMCIGSNLVLIRRIHSGYVKRVLDSKKAPFHKKYEKIFADQRERINYNLKDLRYEKDTLTRELLIAKNELFGIFNLQEAKLIKDSTPSKLTPIPTPIHLFTPRINYSISIDSGNNLLVMERWRRSV